MEYEVRITVTQVITVPVEAESMVQAKALAERRWRDKEYDRKETHSRLRRDKVTYEALYPDSRAMSAHGIIQLRSSKVSERER